jgi:LysM repeat protein
VRKPGGDKDDFGYPTNTLVAYEMGQAEARRDLTNGVLKLKIAGLPSPELWTYKRLLEERCKVQLEPIAGCCVSEGLLRYQAGYNEIIQTRIREKYGTHIFQELDLQAEEEYRREIEARYGGHASGAGRGDKGAERSEGTEAPRTHVVRRGETLIGIARKYSVTVKGLKQANPSVEGSKIFEGQVLKIPAAKGTAEAQHDPQAPRGTENGTAGAR